MSANPNLCTTGMTLLAAGLTAGVITAAAAGSLGGPLELQDEGVFFVNGQAAATAFPDSPPTGAAPCESRARPSRGSSTLPCTDRSMPS